MAKSLSARCFDDFIPSAQSKGRDLFTRGRVGSTILGESSVGAAVEDSDGSIRYVTVDWSCAQDDGILLAKCHCPKFAAGDNCEHVWATILEMDRRGYSVRINGNHNLDIIFDEIRDVDFDSSGALLFPPLRAEFGKTSVAMRSTTSRTKKKAKSVKPPKPPAWNGVVAQVARDLVVQRRGADLPEPTRRKPAAQRTLYLINADVCRRTGELVVDLFEQPFRKDGQWGVPKRLRLMHGQIAQRPDEADRKCLALLVGNQAEDESYSSNYRYSGYSHYRPSVSRVEVNAALYELVLPKLSATGRLGWYSENSEEQATGWKPLVWDEGLPFEFRCAVEEIENPDGWRLSGVLRRAEEQISLAAPVLLMRSGLALFEDRLAGLRADDSFPWLVALRTTPVLEVCRSDAEAFSHAIWSADAPPPCELPEELRYEVVAEAPRLKLRIETPKTNGNYYYSGAKGNLFAHLFFQYGPRELSMRDQEPAIVDQEQRRIYRRNATAEAAALDQLQALGVRRQSIYWNPQNALVLSEPKLPVVARTLAAAGWDVEAQGLKLKVAGNFRLSVSSSVDWFDLEGDCDFGDVQVGIPEVLAAIRRGDDFVKLADGSHGLLPETWLKQLRRLGDLGSEEEGKLRFKPNQALLLDALIAALPACDVDQQFRAVRERLNSFDGIGAADPPQTFQGALREYQREGLGWLAFLRKFRFGGCLADDMGLGKTVQVLAALDEQRTRRVKTGETRAPSLVVVPRSLVHNWIDEAARFTPKLKLLNYTGLARDGLLEDLDKHHVMVTTYGTLRRDVEKLRQIKFDYVILDEAQAVKNSAAQSSKAVRLLQAAHRLAMSGTPIENHLGELWSLFEFLNPGMLGGSSLLQDLTRGPANADGLSQLAGALRPFILRRTKEQVLSELPEKTEQTIYCELEGPQRKLYDGLRDHFRAKLANQVQKNGVDKSRIYVLEALLRLRQAACHPGLLDPKKKSDISAKFDTLFEQLEEIVAEGHKALVFSQFTSLLDLVRLRLDKQKTNYAYLDGRTRKRGEVVQQFQTDPNCKLFLISLKAGGQGLNLTAADYVFILDPWWNPAVEAQAVDRAHRLGQVRPVFAYRLIARDTVEEKILELQREKKQLADALVSAEVGPLSALTADDIERLLS